MCVVVVFCVEGTEVNECGGSEGGQFYEVVERVKDRLSLRKFVEEAVGFSGGFKEFVE